MAIFTKNKCTKHQFIHLLTATLKDLHIKNSKNYKRHPTDESITGQYHWILFENLLQSLLWGGNWLAVAILETKKKKMSIWMFRVEVKVMDEDKVSVRLGVKASLGIQVRKKPVISVSLRRMQNHL